MSKYAGTILYHEDGRTHKVTKGLSRWATENKVPLQNLYKVLKGTCHRAAGWSVTPNPPTGLRRKISMMDPCGEIHEFDSIEAASREIGGHSANLRNIINGNRPDMAHVKGWTVLHCEERAC